ncbi:unnamed protein product [Mesocestoides corti]|uniref:PH domain-containing protein n=1 Tax=Mesocestoides corti TaxID=53468 RepID=A0A158QU17_MESCO|nr:unnamed protein product [Mesocestoides corti]
MAAAFKPLLELGLPDSVSPNQNHHSFNGFETSPLNQRIKTNGSIVRSHSAGDGQMSLVAENRYNGYPHSPYEAEDDDGDNESPPVLLSECPEFQPYLKPSPLQKEIGVLNEEDEIVFGFLPRNGNKTDGNNEDEESAIWELIEAEAEAYCASGRGGEDKSRCLGNLMTQPPAKETISHETPKLNSLHEDPSPPTSGVAALLNCAASELNKLRVGAAVLRKTSVESKESPKPSSFSLPLSQPQPPPPPPQVAAENRHEKTSSTTGTLASLLHIQLAQLNRMSEAVRVEFSNQLAHERALLELLELEHSRVRSEVRAAEKRGETAPPDLTNQLRHLKERLDQQKTLIDDLEYQYLEDKTKYEEEKESLIAQLKLHEDTPSESPHSTSPNRQFRTDDVAPTQADNCYSGFGTVVAQPDSLPTQKTNSPIYSSPVKDSPVDCPGGPSTPVDNGPRNRAFFGENEANLSATSSIAPVPVAENQGHLVRTPPRTLAEYVEGMQSNSGFSHYSPPLLPSTSPSIHRRGNSSVNEPKIPFPLSVFHHQNGRSFEETVTTSSSSSLVPVERDPFQSSFTSSSINIFHAVPPLPPSAAVPEPLMGDCEASMRRPRLDDVMPQPLDGTFIRRRQRTASAATRRVWQDCEARPLTRYLPVPDDISFDLRHHLEVTCGHILCSPLLMPQLHVDATTCAGYLYKIDSRMTTTTTTATRGASTDSQQDVSSSGGDLSFFSPATRRARQVSRVTPPSNGGGFMAALFHRSRRGKRRWFVLDRRRRLLIYYSCQTSKTSSAASLMKPKDVISFTDIIDVYPDNHARKNNTSFCLLLVASCPPPPMMLSPRRRPLPTRTRLLSLAAPSVEAMRVWVDALFTCAGAYLCLPNVNGGGITGLRQHESEEGCEVP